MPSSIAQRRINQFKKNRRAFWALWIFLAVFLFSLCAELVANDKPLLVRYDNGWYFPAFKTYPETTFGGEFETEADYRDPVVAKLIGAKGWMIWPIIHYSYQTINYNLSVPAPAPPSNENWLGTDDQGRDVAARLIYGFRISVVFGLILTAVSSVIGVSLGAISGYRGGLFDLLFQRFLEIWSSMPRLFILIILSSVIAPNFFSLLGLMLIFSWMSLIDVVRAEFYKARNLDYIRAAKALGVADRVIIFKHALPNAMVATVSKLPFIVAGAVTTLTSLDFLGVGMPPGSPSLGDIVLQGKNNLQAPWLGITAFFSLATMLCLFTFIGEGVRDAFDPRKIFRE